MLKDFRRVDQNQTLKVECNPNDNEQEVAEHLRSTYSIECQTFFHELVMDS